MQQVVAVDQIAMRVWGGAGVGNPAASPAETTVLGKTDRAGGSIYGQGRRAISDFDRDT